MRQPLLLVALAAALGVAAYVEWPRATDARPEQRDSAARGTAVVATAATEAPDVHLEALRAGRPTPGAAERNLFKFKPKYVPPPPAPARAALPVGPPPAPQVQPIPLKFIGVLEAAGPQRIAILSDGRGAPMYGKEGEAVLGQYKILKIGAESIEMEHMDGRGRQTIRLSGS